ncbi:unnamed protein product [Staurois parvus]|uniref:Uncharacterized protein n=1 Tax=Staurois parvus TaxID=386267 RepID=A0ABN9GH59_9NEOB|nr:unnamed protein product [Staurois parvus]
MHSPKKKKILSSNTHQTEHVHVTTDSVCIRWSFQQEGGGKEVRIKQPFYTMQRINPLGSTVSITSMLYCIYTLILLLCV